MDLKNNYKKFYLYFFIFIISKMQFPLKLEFNNEEEYKDWLLQEDNRIYIEKIYSSSSVNADQEQIIADISQQLKIMKDNHKITEKENK